MTDSEKVIEEAARAIYGTRDDSYDLDVWEQLDSAQQERYVCDARVALAVFERALTPTARITIEHENGNTVTGTPEQVLNHGHLKPGWKYRDAEPQGEPSSEVPEPSTDLCEWCDMSARGNAHRPAHDQPRRSCGEQYHGEDFKPDPEPQEESPSEREALAQIIKDVTIKWSGPSMAEFANTPPLRKHYATADAILAAGFHRSEPQREPSDAQVDAMQEILYDDYREGDRDVIRRAWRAALRAAGVGGVR